MPENLESLRELLENREAQIVCLERELLEREDECHAKENYFQWFYDQVTKPARELPEIGPKEWLGGFPPRIQEEIESETKEALNNELQWAKEERKKFQEWDRKLTQSKQRTRRYITKIEDKVSRFYETMDDIKGRNPAVKEQYNTLLDVKRKLCWESGEIRGLLKGFEKQRRDFDEKAVKLEHKLSKYL